MKELIPITQQDGKRAVSARQLHAFVEMDTRFDIWINRMLEYGFSENADYQCLIKNVQMPNGGCKSILDDYALSIDCAKEISSIGEYFTITLPDFSSNHGFIFNRSGLQSSILNSFRPALSRREGSR